MLYQLAADFAFDALEFDVALLKEAPGVYQLAADFAFDALILDVSLLKEAAMPATGASTTLTVGFPTDCRGRSAAPDAVLADGATVID